MQTTLHSEPSPPNVSSPATDGSHQNHSDTSRHTTPATSTATDADDKEVQQLFPTKEAGADQDAPASPRNPLDDIEPAYFYAADPVSSSDDQAVAAEDGVPVFHPTMEQFKDFYAFCQAIDKWGMQSGIVKIVPPKEWRDSLPSLKPQYPKTQASTSTNTEGHDADQPADISSVRIRNAIVQHFTPAGSGVWRQTNITRTVKVWNAKQWADTCISPDQKGPEMERMKWKVEVDGITNGGWGPKKLKEGEKDPHAAILEEEGVRTRSGKARPSSTVKEIKSGVKRKRPESKPRASAEAGTSQAQDIPALEDDSKSSSTNGARQQSPTAQTEASANTSPSKAKKAAWADSTTAEEWDKFDYQYGWTKEGLSQDQLAALELRGADTENSSESAVMPPEPSAWNEATCREIESEYWRGLNFGKPPMYGADLKGTLFDDRTQSWNVGKLDNLLTRLRLRRKLPGVTTPYLYWGMWRATFAWHVEDMDLYSINYIHFGAPKQWYAIRQADRQRFESAMASAFPSDARRCPDFMRHKSYLASPSFLASHGIRPVRLVHHAGEFVITYPYGYHSGFNMGFNCAESVNFALESWLDIGRKANYCHCDQAQQSVRMDVDAMLEESKELEEADRRRELRKVKEESSRADEDQEDEKRRIRNEKAREKRKLKREMELASEAAGPSQPSPAKTAVMAVSSNPDEQPCVFCPSTSEEDLVVVPGSTGGNGKGKSGAHQRAAHRLCASFIPETWVGTSDYGKHDVVCGADGISKARYALVSKAWSR